MVSDGRAVNRSRMRTEEPSPPSWRSSSTRAKIAPRPRVGSASCPRGRPCGVRRRATPSRQWSSRSMSGPGRGRRLTRGRSGPGRRRSWHGGVEPRQDVVRRRVQVVEQRQCGCEPPRPRNQGRRSTALAEPESGDHQVCRSGVLLEPTEPARVDASTSSSASDPVSSIARRTWSTSVSSSRSTARTDGSHHSRCISPPSSGSSALVVRMRSPSASDSRCMILRHAASCVSPRRTPAARGVAPVQDPTLDGSFVLDVVQATRHGGSSRARKAARFSSTSPPIAVRASIVALPRWGSSTALSQRAQRVRERPALPRRRRARPRRWSRCSGRSPGRPGRRRHRARCSPGGAVGFIMASWSAPMRWVFSAPPGRCKETKSDSASSSSIDDARRAPGTQVGLGVDVSGAAVEPHHLHAEAGGSPARDCAADPAHPDDAQGASSDLGAHHVGRPPAGPGPGSYVTLALAGPAGCHQQQGHRQVGRRLGQDARGVGHHDAGRSGRPPRRCC